MAVWLKVTLLLIYLAVLFLLARLLEVVALYEHGQISRRLLDPMALSVLKLKALLEQRGVSYDGIVEKSELKELVEATGSVGEEEAESTAVTAVEEVTPITNFTGHLNFYEQVEDAKDSMWLVEVITDTRGVLSDTSWHTIQKKVSKFGVRFGRFDCKINIRLCARRQWYTPRLVLALPDTYKTKANVALDSFSGPIRITSLFDWIKVKVNTQIETISDVKHLKSKWLDYDHALDPEVRVIFISTLSSVPLFLSALSVKFPGRVKMGHIDTKTDKGKAVAKKFNLTNGYFIITKDKNFFYGHGQGETLTFRSFELFLKSIYPNMNDLFICSMILTNVMCCFEMILTSGNVLRRFIRYILCVFKFNLLLMLIWIFILGIVQSGIFRSLCLIGLKGLRFMTTSAGFSFVLKDLLFYSSHLCIPLSVLVLMMLSLTKVKSKCFPNLETVEEDEESDWWNFSNLQTLDYSNWWESTRLRPFDQIFNPTAGIMGMQTDTIFDFQEPVISKDYIKYLPTWRYCNMNANQKQTKKENQAQNCFSHETIKTQDSSKAGGSYGSQRTSSRSTSCSTMSPGNVANSLLDSNYSCECNHMCLCALETSTIDPCNSLTSSHVQDVSNTETPPIDPEEPNLEEIQEDPFTEFTKLYETENLNMHSSKPPGYKDGKQCVICLDNFTGDVLLRGLPCYHVFHSACILAWLMRENHFCPVCRAPTNESKGALPYENLHDE